MAYRNFNELQIVGNLRLACRFAALRHVASKNVLLVLQGLLLAKAVQEKHGTFVRAVLF